MPYDDTFDISKAMDDDIYKYKYAELGEVFGGVLEPENPVLKVIGDAEFVSPHACTDNLMNVISKRLPKPV